MDRPRTLDIKHAMSAQAIADEMGISRQAVDQLISRALAKLQRQLIARGWRADDVVVDGAGDSPAALVEREGLPYR